MAELPLELATGSEQNVAQAARPDASKLDAPTSFTGTAASTSAIPDGVVLVRLIATQACHYRVNPKGTTTAATTSSAFLPASTIEYIRVVPGDTISVIQSSTGGNLHMTAMR